MFNSCTGNEMLKVLYKFHVGLSTLILVLAPEGGGNAYYML